MPDNPDTILAAILDLMAREKAARKVADDLLEARDQVITEAMKRGDISPTYMASVLGFRRQWLYQIAARDQRLPATADA